MPERREELLGSGMEPDSNGVQPQLTDEQWLLISDFFPVPERDPRGGRPRTDARRCLEGIRHTSLVGDASLNGRALACGTKRGADSSTSWIARARWIGRKDSLTARSPRQKKGRSGRSHEAGQGH
jgi:transposase